MANRIEIDETVKNKVSLNIVGNDNVVIIKKKRPDKRKNNQQSKTVKNRQSRVGRLQCDYTEKYVYSR